MRDAARWVTFVFAGMLGACLHTTPTPDLALLIRDQTAEERYEGLMSADSSGLHSTFAISPLVGKALSDIGVVKEIVISRDLPGQIKRRGSIRPPDSRIVHAVRGMRLSPARVDVSESQTNAKNYLRIAYSNRPDVYLLFRKERPVLAYVTTVPLEVSVYSLVGD